MNERIAHLLLAGVLLANVLPTGTFAQSRPEPQRVISRGLPDSARNEASMR